MRRTTEDFIAYMIQKKNISKNTQESYGRDLTQMVEYFYMHGVRDYEMVTDTNLNSYILYMELKGCSNASVARSIATMKGYFDYLFKMKLISNCITDDLKRPMVEKKEIQKADKNQVGQLLEAMKGNSKKCIRDRAMLWVMCTPGMHASELVTMHIDDVNLDVGFLICEKGGKQKMLPIGDKTKEALKEYLGCGRKQLLEDKEETALLFPNMNGKIMSRQGVWKILKSYGEAAGLKQINPTMLSHTFE